MLNVKSERGAVRMYVYVRVWAQGREREGKERRRGERKGVVVDSSKIESEGASIQVLLVGKG